MIELSESVEKTVKAVAGDWAKYAAVGSFALYATGYLALRFHLSVLGLATDLSVLDERYLFAGARFAMYFVAALPNLLLGVLALAVPCWLVSRLMPQSIRANALASLDKPRSVLFLGVLVALISIQLFMRKCFELHDLLLASDLDQQPRYLVDLMLQPQRLPIYFDFLVATCLLTLACLRRLYTFEELSNSLVNGRAVLAVLCVIQFLLLPINYGSCIVDKSLARVTSATALTTPLQTAWLVWEGKTGLTFLVCDRGTRPCSFIMHPIEKKLSIEVTSIDPILPTLFLLDTGVRKTPPFSER